MKMINKGDKMETMPVGKLMLNLGIPMMISMILQALYNIVDSAFVSNMEGGEAALNALTLAFPVQMLMVAVSIGTGVGANVLLAKSLGAKDKEKAGKTAGNAIFLGIVIFVVFMLFGIFATGAYINTQTSNTEIYSMAVSYLRICCITSFGIVFFSVFEKLLQATGFSVYSTIGQISGAVINIVLDPILIYGLFGFPKMGVIGAALATVIGQIASFIMVFVFHVRLNKNIPSGAHYIKPDGQIIKQIYAIGLPAIIAQALMSVMTYAINIILGGINEALVTAYGLYYKIQQFVLFIAFGLRDAITPIISYSHGMKNKKRISDGMKFGILYTLIIMAAGTILIEIFAQPIVGMFGLSGATEKLCISAMQVISLSFIFAGLNVAFQGIFQALDAGVESLVISVCRQVLFVIPTVWILSKVISQDLENAWITWTAFPFAEIISALIGVFLLIKIYRNKVVNKL